MLVILFAFLCAIILIIGYKKPHFLKFFIGQARLLSFTVNAVIKLNGRVIEGARAFYVKRDFRGRNVDELVLYIPDDTSLNRSIFIIDWQKKWLGLPIADFGDYELIQGKYLFQSKAGSEFKVLATAEYNSKFKFLMEGNKIDFNHPLIYDQVIVRVEFDPSLLPMLEYNPQSPKPLSNFDAHNSNHKIRTS
jgi:hypothetical protein